MDTSAFRGWWPWRGDCDQIDGHWNLPPGFVRLLGSHHICGAPLVVIAVLCLTSPPPFFSVLNLHWPLATVPAHDDWYIDFDESGEGESITFGDPDALNSNDGPTFPRDSRDCSLYRRRIDCASAALSVWLSGLLLPPLSELVDDLPRLHPDLWKYIEVLHVKNSSISRARGIIFAIQADYPFIRGQVRAPWDLNGSWAHKLPV